MTLPHSPETPLPTPQQYEHAARMVDASIDETVGGIERYLFNRIRFISDGGTLNERRLLIKANQYGSHLEKRDIRQALSGDTSLKTVRTVALGTAAGHAVVEKLHGRALHTRDIIDHTILINEDLDPNDLRVLIARAGEEGLDLIGDRTGMILDRWQELLTQDFEQGTLFKHMIGLVALGASTAHSAYNIQEANRYEAMRAEAEINRYGSESPEFQERLQALLNGEL